MDKTEKNNVRITKITQPNFDPFPLVKLLNCHTEIKIAATRKIMSSIKK